MAAHIWNGSSWIPIKRLGVWTGSTWDIEDDRYVWNGSSWIPFQDNIIVQNDNASDDDDPQWTIGPNGLVEYTVVFGFQQYSWIDNTANVDQYQIRATTPHSDINGIFNTWLDLTSYRSWSFSSPIDQVRSFDVSIRNKVTQQLVDTATIDLETVI